ncbi:hypothetical protein LCGC14_2386180 [marine sediment metagenome]|uniref:Uncharacterized protein n=1 Tax=marine sediment metagenome TaxID=412755 RepID=A0A0F9BZN2_9ZZZZ
MSELTVEQVEAVVIDLSIIADLALPAGFHWRVNKLAQDWHRQRGEIERLRGALHPERLARNFHRTYERLAPAFSYTTRKESAVPFDDLPDNNKNLMLAVCSEIAELAEDMGNQAAIEKGPQR